ncbi:MAG: hypothetical protein ACRD19_07095 [Terriglobia bacterium]
MTSPNNVYWGSARLSTATRSPVILSGAKDLLVYPWKKQVLRCAQSE